MLTAVFVQLAQRPDVGGFGLPDLLRLLLPVFQVEDEGGQRQEHHDAAIDPREKFGQCVGELHLILDIVGLECLHVHGQFRYFQGLDRGLEYQGVPIH